MRNILNIILILLPFSASAQIGHEFNFEKGKNGLTKSRSVSYMNVKLDEQGMPTPQTENDGEIITLYRDDYAYEVQFFEENEGKNEIITRILLERDGKDIKKAAIYMFSRGKESLLRAHEAFYANGKLTLENITDKEGKLRGTVQYEEGKTAEGIHFIKMSGKGSRNDIEVERHYDDEGDVFTSEQVGGKMKNAWRRVSVVTRDSVRTMEYLILNAHNEKIDSIHGTTRTYFDRKGNPTLQIGQFENPKAELEEEKRMVTVTRYENFYDSEANTPKSNFPTQEGIEGEWGSKKDNLTVFFAPKESDKYEFACFPMSGNRKLIPGLEEKEAIISYEDSWKDDLIGMKNGNYEYDPNTGKIVVHLYNGKIVHLLAKIEWNTLILTPENGNRNALRLVKSRN